jgi:XTP/dITP diphosphohydrolase
MPTQLDLLIATHNRGKIREIEQALRLLPLKLHYLDEFPNLGAVAEVGQTYEANAVLKAMEYSRQSGLCALADDSGLEVDSLNGAPGVFSARYAGDGASDNDRIQKLLGALSSCTDEERRARFLCCMVLVGWQAGAAETTAPEMIQVTWGKCEGRILRAPRGENGFGFDPVFVPSGYAETFGELSSAVKATMSHRALALNEMRMFLMRWLGQT